MQLYLGTGGARCTTVRASGPYLRYGYRRFAPYHVLVHSAHPYRLYCGPFVHSTGKGFVEAKPGQYAGRQRGSLLVPFIVEATGGIARAGRAQCGLLARRAKAASARDRTTYGRARYSTRQFYLHHTRLIAKAAVVNDAMGIREQVQGLRQRVCAAHAAASGWP